MQHQYGIAGGTQTTWLIGGIMYGAITIVYFSLVPAVRRFK